MCEKLVRSFYAACPAETRNHDLLIASPTLYRQRHDATHKGSLRFLSAYPAWHCYHGVTLGTKMQMQNSDGNDDGEDAHADDE